MTIAHFFESSSFGPTESIALVDEMSDAVDFRLMRLVPAELIESDQEMKLRMDQVETALSQKADIEAIIRSRLTPDEMQRELEKLLGDAEERKPPPPAESAAAPEKLDTPPPPPVTENAWIHLPRCNVLDPTRL